MVLSIQGRAVDRYIYDKLSIGGENLCLSVNKRKNT